MKAYIATDYKVEYQDIDDKEFIKLVRMFAGSANIYEDRFNIKVVKTANRDTGIFEFYKDGLSFVKEKNESRWGEFCAELLAAAPEYNDYVRVEIR